MVQNRVSIMFFVAILMHLLSPVCVSGHTSEQQQSLNPRLLQFTQPTVNIGTVREIDGLVKLTFEFKSLADLPVSIVEIRTQCGCVYASNYPKMAIAPGASGVVEVEFNPKNKFGAFKYGLTVVASNGEYRKLNTLVVEGEVISKTPIEEIKYPYIISPEIRSNNTTTIGMRQIVKGSLPITKHITLYNTTTNPIKLSVGSVDASLTVSLPATIMPNDTVNAAFTFDPSKATLGNFDFEVPFTINGKPAPSSFSVKGLIKQE